MPSIGLRVKRLGILLDWVKVWKRALGTDAALFRIPSRHSKGRVRATEACCFVWHKEAVSLTVAPDKRSDNAPDNIS